jgi:pSer/pThr/pTyr-binding forkhead associated (FHA) protein
MGPFSKILGQNTNESSDPTSTGKERTDASKTSEAEASKEQGFGLHLILESGEIKTISTLPVSIGRSDQNSMVIKDDTVSATHARVYYDEQVGNVCIVDLDSLNGLYINDQPTRKNVLYDGAQIRLGKVKLTFRDTGYIHPG